MYPRHVVFFVNQFYYKDDVNINEVFDAERNSVLTPEYEDEIDTSKEHFHNILRQHTGENDEGGISANNAEDSVSVNEDRALTNEERIPVNDAKDKTPANDI